MKGKKNPTLPPLERRNYCFEVRAEEDAQHGNVITGRPVVYSSATDIGGMFEEIIERGALDGTDLSDVRFLVNHDLNKIPLARSRGNSENSTMHLTVTDDGLSFRVVLDVENNSEARALYSAVQRGDITGMSFMFSVGGERWDNLASDYPTRHIDKIESIIEVSAVTFPAYPDTEINARGGPLESSRTALESARRMANRGTAPEGAADELALAKAKLHLYNI